jgi:glycine/D-amino acid oxidase-like deaminating enzyme
MNQPRRELLRSVLDGELVNPDNLGINHILAAKMATTVILGTGVIGTSIALYLSERQPPSSIYLIDNSPELFASASGYAGGFLARDWFSSASAELGALSFDEHRDLAKKDGGAETWGYSPSTAFSLSASHDGTKDAVDSWIRSGESRAQAASGSQSQVAPPPWVNMREGSEVEVISDEGTVAQV